MLPPFPHAAHPLGPSQLSTSGDSQDPQSGNEYDLASDQDSDDVDTIETPDPADVMDADAFEELTQSIDISSRRAINCIPVDNLPDNLEDRQQQTNTIEAGALETQTTAVVIDHFPSESAGTPIPGIPPGSSRYKSDQAAHGGSVWAPFWTQCDWEVAHWVKSYGVTSSMVTKLLAIPEVSPTLYQSFMALNQR